MSTLDSRHHSLTHDDNELKVRACGATRGIRIRLQDGRRLREPEESHETDRRIAEPARSVSFDPSLLLGLKRYRITSDGIESVGCVNEKCEAASDVITKVLPDRGEVVNGLDTKGGKRPRVADTTV